MKVKIGDLTIEQLDYICAQHIPDPFACKHCPLAFEGSIGDYCCSAQYKNRFDKEIEIPDDLFSKENYTITGTCWNSQQGPDGYRLQFETDDEALYKHMEKAAQKCIDMACTNRKD